MATDDFIELEIDHAGKAAFKLIGELKERGKSFKRMFVWAMANDLYDMVSMKMPKDRKYRELANALQVGEGPKNIFAVFVDTNAKRIKQTEKNSTLIYIKAKRTKNGVAQDVKILSDYSPWTVDTLPFWPDTSEAIVRQTKANRNIVDRVSRDKSRIIDRVRRELAQVGSNRDMRKNKTAARKIKAATDYSFQMLTLEFGGGGEAGRGIWRTSLKEIRSMAKTAFKRHKQLRRSVGDPRSSQWKNWPRVDVKVTSAELKSFILFQKQLGYG